LSYVKGLAIVGKTVLLRPGSRKLVQFGFIGLAIAAALIASIQFQPSSSFVSSLLTQDGTLVFGITDASPLLGGAIDCHPCEVTSLNVTMDSLEAHSEGAFNLSGGWVSIPLTSNPYALDIIRLRNVIQPLGSAKVPQSTINLVRLHLGTSAKATISIVNLLGSTVVVTVPLSVPDQKLDANLTSAAQVMRGSSTSITIDFQPTVDCEGVSLIGLQLLSGMCVLHAVFHSSAGTPQ
jgi:hypothetical protein